MDHARGAEFYDRVFKTKSTRYFKRYEAMYQLAAQTVAKNDRVLDLGCGMGNFAAWHLGNNCRWLAVDFSKVGILRARSTWPRFRDRFRVFDIREDWDELDFDYTRVTCLEVLEHIDEDVEVLEKIRSETPVVFSVPKEERMQKGLPQGWPVHRRSYTVDVIYDRYGQAVKIEKIQPVVSWFLVTGRRR